MTNVRHAALGCDKPRGYRLLNNMLEPCIDERDSVLQLEYLDIVHQLVHHVHNVFAFLKMAVFVVSATSLSLIDSACEIVSPIEG